MFDSKRWARGIRPKPFRRASFIHNLNDVSWKNSPRVNMGPARRQAPSQADRAAGAVLPLPVRVGCAPSQTSSPSYAVRQDAYKLDPENPADGILIKHNIDTLEQLETYRQAKLGEIIQLTAERKSLYKNQPRQPTHPASQHRPKTASPRGTALPQNRRALPRGAATPLTEARRDRAEQQKTRTGTRA